MKYKKYLIVAIICSCSWIPSISAMGLVTENQQMTSEISEIHQLNTSLFGLVEQDGNTYFYNEDGTLHLGFKEYNGNLYFFSRWGGAMRTGVFNIDGELYGFNEDGSAMNGLSTYQGNTYYASDGKIQMGFQIINGKKYFFSRWGGAMRTGVFNIDGVIYGFYDSGEAMQGYVTYQGNLYYFNNDGSRYAGFKTRNGQIYFFSQVDGKIKHGWFWYQGYHYYAKETGEIVTGDYEINGMIYHFTNIGRLKLGWSKSHGKTYFLDENGKPVIDWQIIDGKKTFFNSLGELISRNAKFIIDVSKYQGNVDWDKLKRESIVDGVILRIGVGSFYEDVKFAQNIEALKRLGIPYGIYIFSYAENIDEARKEAQSVLDMISRYNLNPILGIYQDLEDWNLGYANSDNISMDTYQNIVVTFHNHLKNAGYNSYVYTGLEYSRKRLNATTRQYIRWISQYNYRCNYTGPYFMWQYSSNEYIPGINGRVDGNVWFN